MNTAPARPAAAGLSLSVRKALLRAAGWLGSGLVLWLSFWFPPLVWVALVPIGLLAVRGVGWRTYLAAWLSGLAFFLAGVQWLRYCDPSAWLGWLLLATYLSLYFPAFVWLARRCHQGLALPAMVAVPVSWVALEYVRMHAFSGFGWLMLAHPLYSWTRTIQITDLAGVYGVSFLVALINGLWIDLLVVPTVVTREGSWRLNPAVIGRLALAGLVLVATWVYGSVRIATARFQDGPRLLLIQTDLEQSLKQTDLDGAWRHVREITGDIARGRLAGDLIVWPETSYPFFYGDVAPDLTDKDLERLRLERRAHLVSGPVTRIAGNDLRLSIQAAKQELQELTDEVGIPLVVGTIRSDYGAAGLKVYNASVLFVPGKGAVGHYDKIHLVPFGEYVPLEESLPWLQRLTPYDENIDFGLDASTEHRTLHHGSLHFGALICFEDTLPHLARAILRTADPPIDFWVNQSNDGWFRGSEEADFHLAASVFRCVEGRLPMARVSNKGITALIDGNGSITKRFEAQGRSKNIAGGMDAVVPLDPRRAPYVTLGDWLPQACLFLCGLAVFWPFLRRSRGAAAGRLA